MKKNNVTHVTMMEQYQKGTYRHGDGLLLAGVAKGFLNELGRVDPQLELVTAHFTHGWGEHHDYTISPDAQLRRPG